MAAVCIVGESDMRDFTSWWERHLPSWIVVYCREGEAELMLQFKPYAFKPGMMAIVPPDMFPAFTSLSGDFRAFYCLVGREVAEKAFYDIPNSFFDAIYTLPVLPVGNTLDVWMELLMLVHGEGQNPYRQHVFSDLLHAFTLEYYNKWNLQYGNQPAIHRRSAADTVCVKFYNLVFDHFREHRDTAFYADKLCITPCYLAMVTRQVYNESPKQAIDRQVTLEIKYLLRNTGQTIQQIANALHFPDASYLCRFFRRQTGFSLSEYRKLGLI